jgi:hypothetical protein
MRSCRPEQAQARLRVAFFTFLTVFGCLLFASSAHANGPRSAAGLTVVVLRASSLDWDAASRSVVAELSATGFRVVEQSSSARTPGQLIDELRTASANAQEVRGSVAVFQESGEGRAYVWIPERENLFQVDIPPDSAAMSAEVLSLRIVELVRVRLLDEPPKPKAAAPRERGLRAVWLTAGPLLSEANGTPPIQLGLSASFAVLDALELDAGGSLSVGTGKSTTGAGSLTYSVNTLSAHGLWRTPDVSRFGFALGAGGGVLVFEGDAQSNGAFVGREQDATVALISARARAELQLDGLAFLLVVEPGVTLPGVTGYADEREIFSFGRPLLLLSAGLGWSQ